MKSWMKKALLLGSAAILIGMVGRNPAVAQSPAASSAPPSASTERAVLDQYCVTCHNDKTKIANLSLQNLDLTTVGDHPELWERVVRKLRAGLMPPPGARRPPLPEYEGLRNWL